MNQADDFSAGRPRQPEAPRGAPRDRAGPAERRARRAAARADRRSLSAVFSQFAEDVVRSADGLIDVYADRTKLTVRRKVVQAAIGLGAAVCAVVWLGSSTLAVVRGVCAGMTTLSGGRGWLGDLTGGLLALTLAGGGIALYLRLSSRRELGRLKVKYERIRSDDGDDHAGTTRAGDAGGVAASGGGARDPEARALGATLG